MATNVLAGGDQVSQTPCVGSGMKKLYDDIDAAFGGREVFVYPDYLPGLESNGFSKIVKTVLDIIGYGEDDEKARKKKTQRISYRFKRTATGTIIVETFPGTPSGESKLQFEIDPLGRLLQGRVPHDLWNGFSGQK